jgi:hypothetical protein
MNVRDALAGGGALLAAVAFVGGTILGGSGAPDAAIDAVSSPAAVCPDGWTDVRSEDKTSHDGSKHVVVNACEWGDWIVYLNEDGSFSHAWDNNSSEFIYDPAKVPAWQ